MPWFDVKLKRTVIRTLQQDASVEVEADSEAEAGKKAAKLGDDEPSCEVYWEDYPDRQYDDAEDCQVVEVSRQLLADTVDNLRLSLSQVSLHIHAGRLDVAKAILNELTEELRPVTPADGRRFSGDDG
jgi:hypothetical protein